MTPIEFPKRYKCTYSDAVVEFTSLNEGTVVVGDDYWYVGSTSRGWINCTNTDHWTPVEMPTINLKDIV